MSLINDALKRASQSQKKQTQAPPGEPSSRPETPVTPPMQPVETPRSFRLFLPITLLVMALLIAAGFWFARGPSGQKYVSDTAAQPKLTSPRASETTTFPATVTASPSAPVARPVPTVTPVVHAQGTIPPATIAKPLTADPITRPSPAPPVETKVPEANVPTGSFPTVKVQGIFFRLKNPSALINGRTLFVGENMQGARLTKIERDSITLQWNGETKTFPISGDK